MNTVSSWKRTLTNLKRERLLTISNIVIMTLTFWIFGLFLSVVVFSQTIITILGEQAQITVFFKDDFTEDRILDLQNQYSSDARISEINYVSKEQALQIFTAQNQDEPALLESASADILPASLEVKTRSLDDLSVLSAEFENIDGVEGVKFFEEVIERFSFWSNIIYTRGLYVVVLSILASYAVIMATLRVTINSKGTELEIMKLVGASDKYVRAPLILEGVFFGTVSAFMAFALLVVRFYSLIRMQVYGLADPNLQFTLFQGFQVSKWVFVGILGVIIISSGVILGYIGSWTTIKRYLKY